MEFLLRGTEQFTPAKRGQRTIGACSQFVPVLRVGNSDFLPSGI